MESKILLYKIRKTEYDGETVRCCRWHLSIGYLSTSYFVAVGMLGSFLLSSIYALFVIACIWIFFIAVPLYIFIYAEGKFNYKNVCDDMVFIIKQIETEEKE